MIACIANFFLWVLVFILLSCIFIFQTDGAFIFNLEGFVPKLCQLAQEVGEDERGCRLRAAGLQALSSMVISFFFLIELLLLLFFP